MIEGAIRAATLAAVAVSLSGCLHGLGAMSALNALNLVGGALDLADPGTTGQAIGAASSAPQATPSPSYVSSSGAGSSAYGSSAYGGTYHGAGSSYRATAHHAHHHR